MAEARQARLTTYFTELKKNVDSENYQKIIKSCNKILAEFDNEPKAWQCKAVALIHLGQFQEALDFIDRSKCISKLIFQKAYCEYRLNDVHAAWNTISSSTEEPNNQIKELKGQILYRLERFDECYGIYRDILRTTSDEFDLERQTNMCAVSANKSLYDPSDANKVTIDSSTYELLYNGATQLLSVGRVEEALAKLQESETMCRAFLAKEDAAEDDINEEVAIIRVQQGYCLQLLSREREALAIYNSVLKSKPEDPALVACVSNNLVSINRTGNIFDSRKRLRAATASGLEHKLTSMQKGGIALNQCLLAYHTQQSDVCLAEATRLEEQYPNLATSARLVKAAQLGKLGQLDDVAATLRKCADEHPQQAYFIKMATVQILLSHGAIDKASEILSSLEENDKYKAGIVSALVTLYSASNNKAAASNILCESVEWHKKNKTSSSQLSDLWRHAADFHLRGGDASTAAASLMQLHKLNPGDVKTLAQLITAYSQFETSKARELSKQLPPVNQLVSDLNVEMLETSVGPKYFRKMAAGKGGDASPASPSSPKSPITPGTDGKTDIKKKKKRKPRLPKECIEGVIPDPERWLPRWQRKIHKKRKDRRNKDVGRGTQGVSSEQADKFDITKTATGTQPKPTGKPIQQPQTKSAPRNVQKKGGKQKKKKTGW